MMYLKVLAIEVKWETLEWKLGWVRAMRCTGNEKINGLWCDWSDPFIRSWRLFWECGPWMWKESRWRGRFVDRSQGYYGALTKIFDWKITNLLVSKTNQQGTWNPSILEQNIKIKKRQINIITVNLFWES